MATRHHGILSTAALLVALAFGAPAQGSEPTQVVDELPTPRPGTDTPPAIPTPANPDTPRDNTATVTDEPADPTDPSGDDARSLTTPPPGVGRHPRPLLGRVAPQPALPRRPGDPDMLALPGFTGAWFYRPQGGGRPARVLVYLHARNADPRESCRTFHAIASRYGWLVCPIGQVDRGSGHREWRNDADYANRETLAAIDALAVRFPHRVRRHDNVVMGFSEGAYVGMNVGLMNPQTFTRWFIMAADDRYIDADGERIRRAAVNVQRIYFLTGETDGVVSHTQRAYDMLSRAWGRRHMRMRVLENAGHELPPDFVHTVRNVLAWVTAPGRPSLAPDAAPEPPTRHRHPAIAIDQSRAHGR